MAAMLSIFIIIVQKQFRETCDEQQALAEEKISRRKRFMHVSNLYKNPRPGSQTNLQQLHRTKVRKIDNT